MNNATLTLTTMLLALVAITHNLQSETYKYDTAGRLISVQYDNGMETIYTYDKNGNMIKSTTDVINSIEEKTITRPLSVSPLPATDMVSISGLSCGNLFVNIVSDLGVNVLSKSINATEGSTVLSIQDLEAGVYTATFSSQLGTQIARIVVL